jgi:hypothetical protein
LFFTVCPKYISTPTANQLARSKQAIYVTSMQNSAISVERLSKRKIFGNSYKLDKKMKIFGLEIKRSKLKIMVTQNLSHR